MYSAYKLNKQGDNILPWGTPVPVLSQLIVPYLVITVVAWPTYRFDQCVSQKSLFNLQEFGDMSAIFLLLMVFPGGSIGKVSACNAGDPGLILGLGRSPEWLPTPVFLHRESYRHRTLVGYNSWSIRDNTTGWLTYTLSTVDF